MLTQIISNRAKKFIRNAFELSVLKPENSNGKKKSNHTTNHYTTKDYTTKLSNGVLWFCIWICKPMT